MVVSAFLAVPETVNVAMAEIVKDMRAGRPCCVSNDCLLSSELVPGGQLRQVLDRDYPGPGPSTTGGSSTVR